MAIDKYDYRHKVCPYCKSKNLKRVVMVPLAENEWRTDERPFEMTGYVCRNCKKYSAINNTKLIFDRGQMRRDMNRLKKLLENKNL